MIVKIIKTITVDTDSKKVISTTQKVEVSDENITKSNIVEDDSEPTVVLSDKKLVINSSAMKLIDAVAGDRICVNYFQKEDNTFIPIIGKQENMGDNVSGNKLTKSHTVSYKGKQFDILSQYGKNFKLSKEGNNVVMIDANHKGMTDIKDTDLSVDDFNLNDNEEEIKPSELSENDFLDFNF